MTAAALPTGYSVLVHKATREPKIVKAGLALPEAVKEASDLYDASKVFAASNLLPSGVALLVASDADAQHIVATRHVPIDQNVVLYQAGAY